MSRKYQVTVPGPVAEQLEQLAAATEQPPTTLAGQFVRSEVARSVADGRVRPLRQLPEIRPLSAALQSPLHRRT